MPRRQMADDLHFVTADAVILAALVVRDARAFVVSA
jgi:hypothetical protein